MYYIHFGLNQAPFKITPNTEFFFSGGNRGPVLEALIYAIVHGEGIVKVTGEVGSGKTMLCHMLQTRLPAHIETVYIANPSVSPDEILRAIAFELQLGPARDAPRLEVMQLLHDFLLQRHAAGKRVVLFVEESQSVPLPTLEEIRLLSNLETSNDKLLQIVLFGQPELDENLRQPHIRQLRDRIAHSFRLEPLTPGEIREYLMFRLRAAGYRGPDLFSPAVVKRIAVASGGLTRRVNLIADKALLAAFSENTYTVRPKHVAAAVRDSEFSQQAVRGIKPRYMWAVGLVAVGAALGVAIYSLLQHLREGVVTASPAPTVSPKGLSKKETSEINGSVTDVAVPAPAAPVPAAAALTVSPVMDADAPPATTPPAPASTVSTPPPPTVVEAVSPGRADPLEARLAATREWLATEGQDTYTIQLLGAENPEQLKHHLNVISKTLETNKIFVYRTFARQKPSLTVLYGSFTDPREAKEALQGLPASLRAYRPLLRTVQGIQGEIRRHEKFEQENKASS